MTALIILCLLGLALICFGGYCLYVAARNAKEYNDEHDLP